MKVQSVNLVVLMAKGTEFGCPKGCHYCGDAPKVCCVPRDQDCCGIGSCAKGLYLCSDGICCPDDWSCSYSYGVKTVALFTHSNDYSRDNIYKVLITTVMRHPCYKNFAVMYNIHQRNHSAEVCSNMKANRGMKTNVN